MNKSLITLVCLAALLLASAACAPAAGPPPLEVPAGAQAGSLTPMEPCQYQPAGSKEQFAAECGTLAVPENWAKEGSRLIALPVVRVPATGEQPAEPVFWVTGGPGAPNLSYAPPDWLLAKHDVVLVGYRGVEGTIQLACPEAGAVSAAHAGRDLFSEAARQDGARAAQQCAERLQAAGVDLFGYTMVGVIEDFEAVRAALHYDRIDLLSESYGTRLAQVYAYMHPDSLRRVVLLGVNTPGHFVWDPAVLDKQVEYLAGLCAQDPACQRRTPDFAAAMREINHNMPDHWLFFPIDPGTVRLATHTMFFSNGSMTLAADAYLAAAAGDPSGLAMLNLLARLISGSDKAVVGDQFAKAASADLEYYQGIDSVSLGDSIMGAPLAQAVWGAGAQWPVEMIPADLRHLEPSDVEMLLVNGTIDFSTPPVVLDEARPYYTHAQFVLLPEFSHTGDLQNLQPGAYERLITSYFDMGQADTSLFVYQPLSFKPGLSLPTLAKLLVAAMIVVPLLIAALAILVVRRVRRRRMVGSPERGIGAVPNRAAG